MANNYLDKTGLIYLWGKIKAALAVKSNTDHTHNYAGSSSAGGAANSATKLQTARTIDGVDFNGASAIMHYGTCGAAAATAAKVVACTGFKLVTGARIIVKFTITNTAANPTLNVNNSGAKAIQYRGSAISAGYLAANRTLEFVYDGSAYQLVGDLDTNTVYTHPAYTARGAGLYKITVDATGHISVVTAVAKEDITALGIPGQDTNTTYSVFKAASASAAGGSGLVPAPAAGKQVSFLRGDGQWVVPTNTTYAVMTGATASAAGKAGLVPAPAASKQTSFLRGDGSWVVPTDTNTWRGIVNNLTSDSTTDSLAAAQGKELKRLIDNAGSKLVDGFTIAATATWTQLTADNIASLDPDYKTVDPALSYPWFTDVAYTCAAGDIIEPMWPANVEGIGPYIKVTANKLRIYADSNKNGTALTAFKCKKG